MIKTLIFDFGGVIATISRDKAVAAFTRIGLNDADARLDKYHQSEYFKHWKKGNSTKSDSAPNWVAFAIGNSLSKR